MPKGIPKNPALAKRRRTLAMKRKADELVVHRLEDAGEQPYGVIVERAHTQDSEMGRVRKAVIIYNLIKGVETMTEVDGQLFVQVLAEIDSRR